jgi:hypothetical protein
MSSYYSPFTPKIDDPESDSASTTSTDSGSSGFTDSTARGLDDPRYAIIRAAGPTLDTDAKQLFYQLQTKNQVFYGSPYDQKDIYDPSTNFVTNIPYLPFVPPQVATKTTLFSINSTNRDMNIYPQSTYFKLKTSRTFKNVTQIQFVQMLFPNFLNATPDASALYTQIATYVSNTNSNLFDFSNCYSCLGNVGTRGFTTSLNGGSFSEAGRTNPVATDNPLVHTFTLKGGSYEPGVTSNEMDKQLNTTPPFNIISYTEHRQLFFRNRNANHLFNEPGKWYYSPSTGTYTRNASKSLIQSDYLPNTILESVEPSEKELFVAYFYPVLKAALYSAYDNKFLNLGTDSLATVNQRVRNYEGLASPYYYNLCYTNLHMLKSIRRVHTFEYHPINSYNYTYSHVDSKMLVSHTDLHPSLTREIQAYYETSKLQVAKDLGYTSRDLAILKAQAAAVTATTGDLNEQLQMALQEVGVSPYIFSKEALGNPNTPLLMQSKQAIATTDSDDALIALTRDVVDSSLSPPAIINRSFPASLGWTTLAQLVQDASNAAVAAPGTRAFTAPYLQQLQSLNRVSSNFPRLYTTFLNSYSTNIGHSTVLTEIQIQGLALTSNYVNKKYASVFPPALLQNNAYLNGKGTGAVTFYSSKNIHYASTPDDTNGRDLTIIKNDASSCCSFMTAAIQNFYSCLPAEYVVNTVFYKMGYGINNILSLYSTNSLTSSTAKNNVYIQLNEEYSLNSMDVAGTENANVSNETTSETNKVFGKILVQGLTAGQTAQTIVQKPALFPSSPLASLDHFTFNFLLDTMVPLSKLYPFVTTGTDWSGILQIDEAVAVLPK